MAYAELFARSCFSLLDGASQPHELVARAAELGLPHLGIADRDSVYGLVQAHKAALEAGVHLVCGATLTVQGAPAVAVWVEDRRGWASLCRLLTAGRAEQPKGRAQVSPRALAEHAGGLWACLRPGWEAPAAAPLREAFGERLSVMVHRDHTPSDRLRTRRALALAKAIDAPLTATSDVRFHHPDRRVVADVLACIRRKTTVQHAGRALLANAERTLLPPERFVTRYHDLPGAVRHAEHVASHCTFALSELRYGYPREVVPDGQTPMSWLRRLTARGLSERYPAGVPSSVRQGVDHELSVIEELDFPSYFLTVYDIVRYARSRGILCQGRGSAANSAVCYALGITAVDPSRASLLFERFISKERGEPPDIDVDFEHERREEVIQYIYARYGRDRAGMVNEFITYRQRSAVRDVGKVFGLSLDQVDRLAKSLDHWGPPDRTPGAKTETITRRAATRDGRGPSAARPGRPSRDRAIERSEQPHEGRGSPLLVPPVEAVVERIREAGLDPASEAVRATLHVAAQLAGFPRHLSIHVGGFVIAADKLVDLVPIEPATMADRTVLQWDKYDIDVLDFVKVDVLALGMLTAIRKAFDLIEEAGGPRWSLATVPPEDPAVYDMFCQADTVGVFQIESRAQMSMLPRLKPKCFYDLVIEVAIVRPGPIQGGMVHPYLRRRSGDDPITYAHPALVPILERTLGVPLFQEQVMAMAVAVGGFTPGEADRLRRAMGAWRKRGNLHEMGTRLVEGMVERGIDRDYADAVFNQILGFGEYGFPESHAASFALLVYVSGWLKRHHPAAFAAALVNSQPMGFYSPRALLADAQRHGVEVLPPCVVRSGHDCTLEPSGAIRVGLRLLESFSEEHSEAILLARAEGAFDRGLADFARRTRLDRRRLQILAESGALAAIAGPDRRQAAWALQGLWTELPLFAGLTRHEPPAELPAQTALDRLKADYRTVGLSVDQHPLQLVRRALRELGVIPLDRLLQHRHGQRVKIAGLVSSRQRPGTAKGVVFMTFEDETGLANLVVWPKTWQRFRRLALQSSLLGCDGQVQRTEGALSVLVERLWALPEPDEEPAEVAEAAPPPDVLPVPLSRIPVRARNFH